MSSSYSVGSPGRVSARGGGLDCGRCRSVQDLLRDMVDHYAHYRRTAEAFAPDWGERHSPAKVVQLLTRQSLTDSRMRPKPHKQAVLALSRYDALMARILQGTLGAARTRYGD